jgi:hypothetical protein
MSNQQPTERAVPGGVPAAPPRPGAGRKAGVVALAVLAAGACMGFSYWLTRPEPAPPRRTALELPKDKPLFKGWPKPDLVLVLSADEQGYLNPCGCSDPQDGGLVRRYNFIQILRDQGWPVVALDLGNVAQKKPPVEQLTNVQQLIKYRYSMLALKAMDYAAVGIGPIEADNLLRFYGEFALQQNPGDRPAVLAANLRARDKEYQPGIEEWAEATAKGSDIKVGVTSVFGAFLAESRPKGDSVQFDFAGDRLKALRAKKADFRVLLYEGFTNVGDAKKQKSEAYSCAEAFPEYQVVVAMEADEPEAKPILVEHKGSGKTMIVTLGHKGKYVGVVGVYKTPKKDGAYELRYQLVELGPEYKTPAAEEKDHPVMKLLEDYTAELKSGDYLHKYTQRKLTAQVEFPGKTRPKFAGSEACQSCHPHAYDVWSKSKHAIAYQTLVNAKNPSNRQYDPECIVCHTVGFGYETGFVDENKTAILKDVGCESCHGPCSEHAKNKDNKDWHKVINPWKYMPKEAKPRLKMEDMCVKCHDHENDVNWLKGGDKSFDAKWKFIEHYTPKKDPPAKDK